MPLRCPLALARGSDSLGSKTRLPHCESRARGGGWEVPYHPHLHGASLPSAPHSSLPPDIRPQSTPSVCSPYPRGLPATAPPPHPPWRGLPDTPLREQAPQVTLTLASGFAVTAVVIWRVGS